MITRSKGLPLLLFDPEIEKSVRRKRRSKRMQGGAMGDAVDPAERMRYLEEQLVRLQTEMAARPVIDARGPTQTIPIPNPILGPAIRANNFELKPTLVGMVSQNTFGGRAVEEPTTHLS